MSSLKAPLISIIVPVYNVEAYIRKCVDSILNQSFSDYELLLIDDGSPDNCGRICDEYAEKNERVRVFHKENGGVSSARNTGLDNCRAEYIVFCDSDDYLEQEWLEKLYCSIDGRQTDLVCADAVVVDETGSIIRREKCGKGSFRMSNAHQRAEFLIKYFLNGGNTGAVWKNIFRTGLIKENGIRFCETCGNYAEDLCFILEYALYCECIEARDITGYHYVLHEGSMMSEGAVKPKFNEVNEVSKQFGNRYISLCDNTEDRKVLSVIHYMILRPEYHKIIRDRQWGRLSAAIREINDKQWFRHHTVYAFKAFQLFTRMLGIKEAMRAMLSSVIGLNCCR